MPNDLLPLNATAEEKAQSLVISSLVDIDLPNRTLWHPETCPIESLPWLAWSLSVDYWNSEWEEGIKRQVVGSAISLHRIKGSVLSVKQAIAALDITAEIKEWFEVNALPHTFSVTAWSNDNINDKGCGRLTQQAFIDVERAIIQTKPVRSHLTLQFGTKLELNQAISYHVQPNQTLQGCIEIVSSPIILETRKQISYHPVTISPIRDVITII